MSVDTDNLQFQIAVQPTLLWDEDEQWAQESENISKKVTGVNN